MCVCVCVCVFFFFSHLNTSELLCELKERVAREERVGAGLVHGADAHARQVLGDLLQPPVQAVDPIHHVPSGGAARAVRACLC